MDLAKQANAALAANTRIDLSENLGLTVKLIERPWLWKHRLVETLEFESATDVRATSAYQIEFPPEMLAEIGAAHAISANVIIPLTTRPKRPLLRFDIRTSHGAPAHLISRKSIAAIQAVYVRSLAQASPAATNLDGFSEELIDAIGVFSPGLYAQWLKSFGRVQAVRRHLFSGIRVDVSREQVAGWLQRLDAAVGVLTCALNEPADALSSSENVLLAVPHLDDFPKTAEAIDGIVSDYCDAVTAAKTAGDRDILAAVGEYGRRWEMLVEVEVPLHRPSEIVISEDRPLQLDRGGWARQAVALSDAASTHIQITALDRNVQIDRYEVRDLTPRVVGLGVFEAVRYTRDTLALYTSVDDRPDVVDLGVQLRPAGYVRWTGIIAAAVTMSAAGAAAIAAPSAERLAVLTLPTTIASTLVLVREQSGLAVELTRATRKFLAASLLVLWIVLLARVLSLGLATEVHHAAHDTRDALDRFGDWGWSLRRSVLGAYAIRL